MTDALERFFARAELFMERVEASLPHTLTVAALLAKASSARWLTWAP